MLPPQARSYWNDSKGKLWYIPKVFPEELFLKLEAEIAWQQDSIRMFGKLLPLPRLTAWYGDPGAVYRYSGIVNHPKPWTPLLLNLKETVEGLLDQRFNSVLLNRYADGQDYQGYHADDEPELGSEPNIASLSFGEARMFRFKEKLGPARFGILLEPGSLLWMSGALQEHFLHALPKSKKVQGPRINLTFRFIEGA